MESKSSIIGLLAILAIVLAQAIPETVEIPDNARIGSYQMYNINCTMCSEDLAKYWMQKEGIYNITVNWQVAQFTVIYNPKIRGTQDFKQSPVYGKYSVLTGQEYVELFQDKPYKEKQ